FNSILTEINSAHEALRDNLKQKSTELLKEGKLVAVLGGEHSTPLGLIQALNEVHDDFGVLQIDAHADLRKAYEGFEQSHASIMYNVLQDCKNLSKLVQVGIRDIAPSEVEMIKSNPKISTFFDWDLKKNEFEGVTWNTQVNAIIASLPQKVYISFDIDGLIPNLCPNTGTPVPGGMSLEQVNFLFTKLVESGKTVIGFDLNEVSPDPHSEWDANVGARALWHLTCMIEKQRRTMHII
ncbi:MAG: agmatinase, partial [Lentimonas sp.]